MLSFICQCAQKSHWSLSDCIDLLKVKNWYSAIMLSWIYRGVKWTSLSFIERRRATKTWNALCMAGVQRNYFLLIVAAKWGNKFGKILFQNDNCDRKNRPELRNRWGIVFQHGNAQHLIAINVRTHFNVYGWSDSCHPSY